MRNKFLLLSVLLSGCGTLPGSHVDLSDKEIVTVQSEESTKQTKVKVYVITPALVKELKEEPAVAQPNPELQDQVNQYVYRIGAADILNITVWNHPELTTPAGMYRSPADSGTWVQYDGTIFYPYVNKIQAEGKTVEELRVNLSRKLSAYISNPQVDVTVASFNSQKVYVTGEVTKVGVQPITNIPLTLLDAINHAGGITERADWRHVVVTQNGQEEIISLEGLMQRGDLSNNRLLQNGDIVYVPRDDNLKVFVMGEVGHQRAVVMNRSGLTLTEALGQAEGVSNEYADASGVFVIRAEEKEGAYEESLYQLNMKDATALALGTRFQLKPNDVIYVTTAPVSRWNRLIMQILPTVSAIHESTEAVKFIRNWND